MNTKHTPAPWAVTNKGSFVVTKHATICRLFGRDDSDYPNSEANAKLIAISPVMFEYLVKKADEGCEEAKNILSMLD